MFRNGFPAVESAITLAAGAADGLVSSNDVKNNRTQWQHRRSTFLIGGLTLAGVAGGAFNMKRKFTDPLLLSGLVLGSREAAFAAAQKGATAPAVAWGRAIDTNAAAPALPVEAAAYGLSNSGRSNAHQYVQNVSSLG